MPDSTLAGVISAVAAVFTALALVISAIGTIMAIRKGGRKIDTVHKLVNQQHTDMLNYQRALIRELKAAGLSVPEDQSDPDPLPSADPPADSAPKHRTAR